METGFDPTDPSRYVRRLLEAFNTRRKMLFVAGWMLTEDELMVLWLGAEGVRDGFGADPFPIPNLSYIERKPDPLGAELKVLACAVSGMTLRVELQEGAERHAQQEWFDEYGHTTACQLRLLKDFFGTGNANCEVPQRGLYGDSWFMGVNAVEVIYSEVCRAPEPLRSLPCPPPCPALPCPALPCPAPPYALLAEP